MVEYQNKTKGSRSEFIVITGYVDDNVAKELALFGIMNFTDIPFDSCIFLETVKRCLEDKKREEPILQIILFGKVKQGNLV